MFKKFCVSFAILYTVFGLGLFLSFLYKDGGLDAALVSLPVGIIGVGASIMLLAASGYK